MYKTMRALCVLLACSLAFMAMAASAAERVSDTRWGVYAKLAGKQGTFIEDGKQFQEQYVWVYPGRVLQLKRVEVASGKEWFHAEIGLGETPGTLYVDYNGRVLRGERDIRLQEDGSALWLQGMLTGPPMLLEATADGGWTEKTVSLDKAGNITRVRSELQRTPSGGAAPIRPDVSGTPMPPIEAWGVLGRLAGTQWNLADSNRSASYEWLQEGHLLAEYWRVPGNPRHKPGLYRLDPTTGEIAYDEWQFRQWTGTVQPDGSITFVYEGASNIPYRMWLAEDGVLHRQDGSMEHGRFVAETTKYDRHDVLVAQAASGAPNASRAELAATGTGATQVPTREMTAAVPASQPVPATSAGAAASAGGDRPLSQNRRWADFGPLSYFVGETLYDEQHEDLIAIVENDQGIAIVSPDRTARDLALRAFVTTSLTGKPLFVRHGYGTELGSETGKLLTDGSIRFRSHNVILRMTLENSFARQPNNCLEWVERFRLGKDDNTKVRTFCRVRSEAEAQAAASKHAARNVRTGVDSGSVSRASRDQKARDAEDKTKRQAASNSEGSGWVGAQIGAAVGVVAAKSYGGGAEEIATAAMMGATMGNPGSGALAHGANVFQEEMAKKDAEHAAADARIAALAAQAQAAEDERQRQRHEAAERQQQLARDQASQAAAQARQREVEQQRLASENATAERERQAELARQKQAEQRRVAAEQAKERKQQELRQAEATLRSSFRGRAITCAGGGKDVLYLQGSQPAKTGCNVSFEARCPGAAVGVQFSQQNWIGASCGFGDNVRIGHMECAAEQVQVSMTSADCG